MQTAPFMSYLCIAFEMHHACKWFGACYASLTLLLRFGYAFKWKTNKKGVRDERLGVRSEE